MSQSDAERERRSFAARVSLLFAALSVIIGTNLPYPARVARLGGPVVQREIAVITATPLIVRLGVTPAIAFAADRAGDHRKFLIGLSWAGLAGLIALAQSRGFWPILAWTVVFSLAWTTILPLTETVAMSGVKAAGLDYGRMRLWGSLSFIAASLVGGWVVQRLGAGSAIWLVVAGAVLTTAATHGLAAADRARAAEGRDQPAAAVDCRRREPAALAHLPAVPGGSRPGAGRARGVLHLRHPALARSRPVDRLVRRPVGDLHRRRGGAVRLLRRGGAAHRAGAADRGSAPVPR